MIQVRNLHKSYRVHSARKGVAGAFRDLFSRQSYEVNAVQDISFHIPRGEIAGYIGENGAGKSTTIKMLTGILTPSCGEIICNGMNPHMQREAYVKTIGVVFGQRSQLWWDIAVQESFRLLKKVYQVDDRTYQHHMDLILSTLDLSELLDKPVRKLSLGQRMRAELAAALLHNPAILFLDEPTIGLDVLVKMKIREFLKEINQTYQTTILLTTHDISDIEALCERVIMLDGGNIIYDGNLSELRRKYVTEKQISFEFTKPTDIQTLSSQTEHLNLKWKAGENMHQWIGILPISIREKASISEVMTAVSKQNEIVDLQVRELALEEIIRKIYEKGAVHG